MEPPRTQIFHLVTSADPSDVREPYKEMNFPELLDLTAFPNPFNSNTIIGFDLPIPAPVNISVYDMQGRSVNIFENISLPAGHHSIEWKAGVLGSGVYLYRMKAGKFDQSTRLMLVR